jgi:hypothetical protein
MPEEYRFLSWGIKAYWMQILFVLFPVATILYVMLLANPFMLLRPGVISQVDVATATLWTLISINVALIFILVEFTTLYMMWFAQKGKR